MGKLGELFDLKPKSRAAFVIAFLGLELMAIAWGLRAPDHVLGFQMFNESSRLNVQLFREVQRKRRRVLVPVLDGKWQARDAAGALRDFSWQDRVKYEPLSRLGVWVHASYGLSAQLFRLQAALDDVASHIPDDTQTRALVAVVEATHNGRPETIRLRADRP
jgi:hypothetical protein